jgi:hypothetical protein
MTRFTRKLAFTIVGAFFLCAHSWAVGTEPAGASDVLVGVYALDRGMESLRPVIVSAIQYKLSNRGLSVAVQPSGEQGSDVDAQAARNGNPIALKCLYSSANNRLSVSLEWRDLQKGGKPVTSEQSGPLDLSADAVILQAVDSLLSAVSERIDALARARAARLPPPPVSPPAVKTAPTGPAVAGSQIPSGGFSPPRPAQGAAPSASTRRFALTTGFAPFIAVGPASYYFTVGLLPSVLASLEFSTGAGRFAVGLYAATNYFSAVGLTDSSNNFMIAVGPDVRYALGDGRPFLAFAHLSGGPALLLMSSASQGMLMDITAFMKSGIGATVYVTAWMGVSLSADYEMYFEMPYLIMGFSPTVLMTFLM